MNAFHNQTIQHTNRMVKRKLEKFQDGSEVSAQKIGVMYAAAFL